MDDLDRKSRQLVVSDLEDLGNFPLCEKSLDIAKLKGEENSFRLRTGKNRTIFSIEEKSRTILVRKIAYRENVYE